MAKQHRCFNVIRQDLHGCGDYRKEKRAERKAGMRDQIYFAFIDGQFARRDGLAVDTNPYPKGFRHDAWLNGYDLGWPQ